MNDRRIRTRWTRRLALAGVTAGIALIGAPLVGLGLANSRDSDRPATDSADSRQEATTATGDIHWREDFDAALAEAAKQQRPVLLRFTASWCAPCRVMDARVFPDDRVKSAIKERVIPLKIDVDVEQSATVARRYGVGGVPTLILVDATGKEITRGGFMSAEQLVKFLEANSAD